MNDYEKGYQDGVKDRHTQIMMVFDSAEDKFCCSFGDEGCLHGMCKHLREQINNLYLFMVHKGLDYETGCSNGACHWKSQVLRIFDTMGKNIEGLPKEGCGRGVHSVLKRYIVEAYNDRETT